MNKNLINWLIFSILALTWGSSFILMKLGLQQLSPYQVAALRIFAAGVLLLPITIKNISSIPKENLLLLFLSGTLGSLLPAFLFCIAEEKLDSAIAGILNSLTPVFVIITGVIFFKATTTANKTIGILIAFLGCVLLFLSKGHLLVDMNFTSTSLIILATILYGFNVNMVSKNLLHIPSLNIAAVALSFNAIPALLVLIYTGYFKLPLANKDVLLATGAAVLLGVLGTAIATILFYILVKKAGGIFASMVTYGIPFVAIGWGIVYGESFGWAQAFCLIIILAGVFYTTKKKIQII